MFHACLFFFLSILLFLLYSTFANRLITPFTSTVIKTFIHEIFLQN